MRTAYPLAYPKKTAASRPRAIQDALTVYTHTRSSRLISRQPNGDRYITRRYLRRSLVRQSAAAAADSHGSKWVDLTVAAAAAAASGHRRLLRKLPITRLNISGSDAHLNLSAL